jgi:TrmH family RNA methyltransferase
VIVTSRDNPRLKRARRLLTSRRARSSSGLFVAEGEDLLEAALRAGVPPLEVLATPDAALPAGLDAVRVQEPLLAEVSTLGHAARVLALFRRPDLPVAALGDVAVALYDVHDPGNVGAVLRSVAALGRGSAGLGPGCADVTGPKAVRASMGAVFSVPAVDPATLPGRQVALAADAPVELADVDLRGPVVFLLGGERSGLSEAIRERAALSARIPQAADVDSLNVAMAATVALYEARRQRR